MLGGFAWADAPASQPAEPMPQILFMRGLHELSGGQPDLSLRDCEEALKLYRKLYGSQDRIEVAECTEIVGASLQRLGRAGEALVQYESSLQMFRRIYGGKDHIEQIWCLQGMGTCLESLGRPADGLPKLQEALAMLERISGGAPRAAVARAMIEVGVCFEAMGDVTDALGQFDGALETFRKVYGKQDNIELVGALNMTGLAMESLGRGADALPRYQEAAQMLSRLSGNADSTQVGEIMNSAARCLDAVGRGKEALPVHEAVLAINLRIYKGQDDLTVARSLNNLAVCLKSLDRDDEAMPKFKAALEMFRRIYGDQDQLVVATSLRNLGSCLDDEGEYVAALPYYQQSLEMFQRLNPGQDKKVIARGLTDCASVLEALARYSEALPDFQAALQIYQRLGKGSDGEDVAGAYGALAGCLEEMGQYEEGLKDFQVALEMSRGIAGGQDSSDVASYLNSVGRCLQNLGRSDEALADYQAALAMFRRISGSEENADVAISQNNVANCLREMGRNSEALPLLRANYELTRRINNNQDSQETVASLDNLASCLRAVGQSAVALPMFQEALAMRQRLHNGQDHPDTAGTMSNMGVCLLVLGRYEEALNELQGSLEMLRRIFKDGDNPRIAIGLNNLANAQQKMGNNSAALESMKEALTISEHIYAGKDHPQVAIDLSNTACCLDDLGRYSEALPEHRAALELFEKIYQHQDHPNTAAVNLMLGLCLHHLGRDREALTACQSAWEMAQRVGSPVIYHDSDAVGMIRMSLGDAAGADTAFEQSIDTLEQAREALGGDDQDRMAFMAAEQSWDPFSGIVRAELQLQRFDKAAEYLDRGRARSLLDILQRAETLSGGDILGPVEAKAKSSGNEAELKEIERARADLVGAEDHVRKLMSRLDHFRAMNDAQGLKEIQQLQDELAGAQQQYRDAHRRVFNLAGATALAQPATVSQIQSLPRAGEHVLMYSITHDDALVLLIPPAGQQVVGMYLTQADGKTKLSGKELVEELREYRQAVLQNGKDAMRGARLADQPTMVPSNIDLPAVGYDLFCRLMPRAIWEQIQHDDLVYVIPDVAMSGVPLEMLVVKKPTSADPKDATFWIDQGAPLCYGPSAAALLQLRHTESGTQQRSYAREAVLLGDPVLRRGENDNTRVAPPTEGALVLSAQAGSPGENIGLRPGAVLISYDQFAINGRNQFDEAVEQLMMLKYHGKLAGTPKLKFWLDGQIVQRELSLDAEPGVELADLTPQVVKELADGNYGQPAQTVALRDSTVTRFGALTPLPGTRTEVEGIYRVLTGQAYQQSKDSSVVVLLGEDATSQQLAEQASGARYLHLATHGMVESGERAIYSSVVLSLPTLISPQDTGLLTLQDLFDHWWGKLDGTELVVLSACDSEGLDQRGANAVGGEGVFGLPWGFMYAGSSAVVASLWEVQDASTAELMQKFYGDMRSSSTPGKLAAFSTARKQLKQQYPQPFFWAPFIYLGDPN
jgi:tetratricopeptide (TPR) repeat protein